MARRALTAVLREIDGGRSNSRPEMTSIGAFQGLGGLIYTLAHLSVLWAETELAARANTIVETLPVLIDQDEHLDIIGGAAGCITSLLALYRTAGCESALAAAVQCGNRLVERCNMKMPALLTGFSHGAAGMASALLELASIAGEEERFRRAAFELTAWERGHFCADRGNWLDLRDPAQPSFKVAWCHGAPGIGIARLRSLPYHDDSLVRAEIGVALETTRAAGFGRNDSLCHGDLGNLELLLLASRLLPGCKDEADRIAAGIVNRTQQNGWLCGVPLGVETPGLMTGLAGIGYGFLRLADPAEVPSVLALAPPLCSSVLKSAESVA